MIFYHVDRLGLLQENQTILLSKDFPHYLNSYKKTILKLYPDGLSNHGLQYGTIPIQPINQYELHLRENQIIENIFELNRQIYFPNILSRFQSFFCFKSLKEAIDFFSNELETYPNIQIFEINTSDKNIFIGDMQWLNGTTVITAHENSIKYWSGTLSDNPKIEILVKPPIKIGLKIQ